MRKALALVFVLTVVLLIVGCATPNPPTPAPSNTGPVTEGIIYDLLRDQLFIPLQLDMNWEKLEAGDQFAIRNSAGTLYEFVNVDGALVIYSENQKFERDLDDVLVLPMAYENQNGQAQFDGIIIIVKQNGQIWVERSLANATEDQIRLIGNFVIVYQQSQNNQ